MEHTEVRAMLSAGEPVAGDAEAHLAKCRTCARWRDSLERVRALAPSTFEVPSGLSERIIAPLRTATTTTTVLAPAAGVSAGLWRRLGFRVAIAGGLAAAIAGVALLVPRGGTPALAAALEKTERARTARFESLTTFRIEPRPELGNRPPFTGLPPGVLERLEQLPVEVREQTRRALTDAAKAAQDALRGAAAGAGPISGRINGRGEIVFPDRIHMFGAFTSSASSAAFAIAGDSFEAIVVGDRSWMRRGFGGESWFRVPKAPVTLRIDFDPSDALAELRRFGGEVQDMGETTFYGERVRRYGVRLPADRTSGRVSAAATVYVGVADGLLRGYQLDQRVSVDSVTVEVGSGFRLFDFGVEVTVEPPASAGTVDIDVSVGPLYFGGTSVSIDLDIRGVPGGSGGFQGSSQPWPRPPTGSWTVPPYPTPTWSMPTWTPPGMPR